MVLTNKTYNVLKWIAQYLLPALGTLYFALSTIWGLPYGEQIVGTLSAFTVFLGVVLGISTSQYKKNGVQSDGTLQIDTQNPEKDIYRLEINDDITTLANKNTITLKVNPNVNLSQK